MANWWMLRCRPRHTQAAVGLARVLDNSWKFLTGTEGLTDSNPLVRYDRCDRREVPSGIGLHFLYKCGLMAIMLSRGSPAISRRARTLRPDPSRVAVRAGRFSNDHRWPDQFGEPLSNDPRRNIGRAPGGIGHDELDRRGRYCAPEATENKTANCPM